jgi:FkbM family methyltransferase
MPNLEPVALNFQSLDFRLCAPAAKDFIAEEVALGTFEQPMPSVVVALARMLGGTMLDIGANNGIYSILACLAHGGLTSIAFEPYPPVIDVLQRNVALNSLEARISIEKYALSDSAGQAPLFVPHQPHGLLETSCSLEPDFKEAVADSIMIETRRLDTLTSPAPTIIKLDVEGHEAKVLAGGRNTIAAAKPIIFVEVLRHADPTIMNEIAAENGYGRYRLRHDGVVVREQEIAFDLHAWNHVLVPRTYARRFDEAVASVGIPFV